jgi:uncharacterized protein YndB with AHSA1/START domain
MVKFEVSAHINRPVADVFKYMADPTKVPEWNSLVEEAKASESPVSKGTKITATVRFLGRRFEAPSEVTEYEPNKRYVQKTDKPFPSSISNAFEAEGEGTKVISGFDGEPGGFFKVAEPILGRIAKKQFQAQLDTAKELLEAQVPAAS